SYSYVRRTQENLKNPKEIVIPASKRIYVNIPSGSSTRAIAETLEKEGLIEYPQLFRILSKINGYDGLYKPGTHIVSEDLGYEEFMMVLITDPEIVRLTFPEGLNSRQIYDVLSKSQLTRGKDVRAYIQESAEGDFTDFAFLYGLHGLPERREPLEGYLFPDTYDFDLNAAPKAIVETLLKNFGRKIPDEYYRRAQELGMTMDDVITLASVIEREAKDEADRFLVSGVFHNRLASGDESMRRLQSCATIQYIFYQRNGVMLKQISDADTRVVDPYNTYTHAGLPPGPICNPGISSINAALYPDTTEYMFFVARGDGTHQFSRTYDEHLDAIEEYGLNLLP
ncbi:MAG: endolytic transglycosylase MltG, partial [Clostridiales bacterium]|nr:endolytic transglycosylase MltG [Clostridiales bacterium]